jgi:hypothetical protein
LTVGRIKKITLKCLYFQLFKSYAIKRKHSTVFRKFNTAKELTLSLEKLMLLKVNVLSSETLSAVNNLIFQ